MKIVCSPIERDRPHKVSLPALSIREVLGEDIARNGVKHAIAQYRTLKAERASEFHITEGALNILGYNPLWADRLDDAAAILKLTMEEYPNSANVYDSYGDALLAKGDTANALTQFKQVRGDESLVHRGRRRRARSWKGKSRRAGEVLGSRPAHSTDPNGIIERRVIVGHNTTGFVRDADNVMILPERIIERIVQVQAAYVEQCHNLLHAVVIAAARPCQMFLQ